jgi:hypothetical protein
MGESNEESDTEQSAVKINKKKIRDVEEQECAENKNTKE